VFKVGPTATGADVVRGEVEWRRSSLSVRMKGLKLISADTGEPITDARVVKYDQEGAVIDFRPAAGPGVYHLYYGAHEPACFDPSEAWLAVTEAAQPSLADALRIEARCDIDAFDEMELIALPGEVAALLERYPDEPYLVFPEDRDRSIKLQFEIPVSWALDGPKDEFILSADRHEYRVFQLGVWACRAGLRGIKVDFTDLCSPDGAVAIPAEGLQCLTLESRIRSRYIAKPKGPFPVPKGEVRAVWCGIDIPKDTTAGEYHGVVTIRPVGDAEASETSVRLRLVVSDVLVPERGDHDRRRLSRLRWVESDVGLSDEVFPPYEPLRVSAEARGISTWGHTFSLDASGLPAQLRVAAEEVLATPIALTCNAERQELRWNDAALAITAAAPGYVEWETEATDLGIQRRVRGRIEYDGSAVNTIELRSADGAPCTIRNLVLTVPWAKEHAALATGMGYQGRRTGGRSWRSIGRSASGPSPMVWMGSVDAGLGFTTWDMAPWDDASRPDAATITEEENAVVLRLNLGTHTVEGGKAWHMQFALLPTPVKPLDERHWQFRYAHRGGGFWPTDSDTPQSYLEDDCKRLDEIEALGVRRLNLHDWWGPAFNYPWQWDGPDNLARLATEAHKRRLFVKVYNSGRELSAFAPEFWFLVYEGTGWRFADGVNPNPTLSQQHAWKENHLPDAFGPGWPRCHRDLGNEVTIPVSNHTRNGNFYLESMRYMTRFFGTDGAYWDGADGPTLGHREMAKRLWVMFRQTNPNATVDVHHGHPLTTPPTALHMLCFPFIDSLWHGEGFDYDRLDPWAWLVEVAAIPFNVPSEMLTGFEYPGRGMLFGIWPRYGWGGEPDYVPKLWQFFDQFGIEETTMLGWWLEPLGMGRNGVTVDRYATHVTAFKHPTNGVLLAIATWHTPFPHWMGATFDVSLLLDRQVLGLPEGPLAATDIFTENEVDVTKPVPLPDMKAGRLIWVRGT